MKTRLAYVLLMASSMSFVACQSELVETAVEDISSATTIIALADKIENDADTKASMAYKYDILWEAGDEIYVEDVDGNNDLFVLSGGAGTNKGTFSKKTNASLSGEVMALYPASIVDQGRDDLIWPAVQTESQPMLMYSETTLVSGQNEQIGFKSMGAMLQLNISSLTPGVTLKSIKIQDGSKSLSGHFSFADAGIDWLESNNDGITLDLGSGKALGQSPKSYFICVPPGTYGAVTFTFTSVDGLVCRKGPVNLGEIKRNTVRKVTSSCEFTRDAVQLWADGPYWATMNVGASSPEEYGLYFTWGNAAGYSPSGSTFSYSFDTSSYTGTPGSLLTGDIPWDAGHDAAQNIWGQEWWIPEASDFTALIENCTWTWCNGTTTKYNGTAVKGYIVTGKGTFSDKSIFLPAAGMGSDTDLKFLGLSGEYWSRSGNDDTRARILDFENTYFNCGSTGTWKYRGLTIRPVSNSFTPVTVTGIELDNTSLDLYLHETAQLTATVLPSNATNKDVTWSSSDPLSVSVDGTGLVSAVAPGLAIIKATTSDGGFSAECLVTSNIVPATGVSLNQTSLTMIEGGSFQLTASVLPANAANKEVIWTSDNVSVATVDNTGMIKAKNLGSATISVITKDGGLKATCAVTVKGPISGKFSVGAGKQIQFSPGNLQATYDGNKYTWNFAAHQYDYVGDKAGNTTIDSQTAGAVVDLFGWSTAATNFGINTSENNSDYSGDFVDWGNNIGDGSTWRTLTAIEWNYLFNTRTNAYYLSSRGTVCGRSCLIIAPDGYTGTIAASYDASTWPAAEAAGLVCLPEAGYRHGSTVVLSHIGCYWTSSVHTLDSNRAYSAESYIDYDYGGVIGVGSGYRYEGYSVRLVKDVTPEPLSGKFSVASGKQIQFSRGNLQATYNGSKYSWGFAANQYDYIGNAPGNTTIDSQTVGAVVDLFGWSTAATNFGINTSENNSDYSGNFVDWGKNIDDGSTWRTLTGSEWDYLLNTRTNAYSLCRLGVTVCGRSCLIIAPDGYTGTIAASYDASTWPAAEAAGLVCLPEAGYRDGSTVVLSYIGFYWSSSAFDSNSAYYGVVYSDGNVYDVDSGYRYYGQSVRLVTDVR